MKQVASGGVHLVVTSPPYPMIEMWDGVFSARNKKIEKALGREDGAAAFELMHAELDKVWAEAYRVLCDGGIACINIGDAVRTMRGVFQLYNSHTRILSRCLELGFVSLPAIIWRKQTNAPNKFMGSGMLPPGAYVTLEHEFILILRKGGKREFITKEEKENRRRGAYFWEERNAWFSDVWFDLKGTTQDLKDKDMRERSGAFPFELVYRLINMFSLPGDTVLDPFMGTGVTMSAAMASERNSVGYEIDESFKKIIETRASGALEVGNDRIRKRLEDHVSFARERAARSGELRKRNSTYGFPCVSGQETGIALRDLKSVARSGDCEFEVEYEDAPREEFCGLFDGGGVENSTRKSVDISNRKKNLSLDFK